MANSIKDPELKKPTPASFDQPKAHQPLQEFFLDALKDIYWAEKELLKTLPKMKDAATSVELSAAIQEHFIQTKVHAQRLEEIFQILGQPAEAKLCFAMQGLVKEGDSIIDETREGTMTRDAALILAAQKVEHYEIATYGALSEYSKTLGLNDVHGLLQATLEEERMADQGLTLIAQNKINWEADFEQEQGPDSPGKDKKRSQ